MNPPTENTDAVRPRLGLWDTISIILGIVVGTTIFRASATIFDKSGNPWTAMILWLVGGALAWCGAVCYAELATTYPRDGGDYQYLNRAYGTWAGFLFAWAQIVCIISGNIAIMAYAFADYAVRLAPAWTSHAIWLTTAPVVVLSALNLVGVVAGKTAQNILTLAKVVGLAALIITGAIAGGSQPPAPLASASPLSATNLGLALVFVLYAYGGWSHAAYVAAEVRDERRNLPRALIFGLASITVIYLLVNAAYLHVLGFNAARATTTPAADLMERALGPRGGQVISALVMLSALSAINGMVLTGTRIYAVWGADYPALKWLGEWNKNTGAPIAAIAVQAVVAVLLIALVGTDTGQKSFDSVLHFVGIPGLPWKQYFGGFETLVAGSAPVYWALCLLTGVAVFILRAIDPDRERPYRIPLFPVPAILFCITCAYMLYSSAAYAKWLVLLSVVPVALGGIAWCAMRQRVR